MRFTILLFFIVFSFGCFGQIPAAKLLVNWEKSINGAGYRIYYGQFSGSYDFFIDVGDINSFLIQNLNYNSTYYIAITSFNSWGLESDFSNEVSAKTLSDRLNPPGQIFISQAFDLNFTIEFSGKTNRSGAVAPTFIVKLPENVNGSVTLTAVTIVNGVSSTRTITTTNKIGAFPTTKYFIKPTVEFKITRYTFNPEIISTYQY